MLDSYGFIEMYLVCPGLLRFWRVVKSKLATISKVSEVAVLVGGCAWTIESCYQPQFLQKKTNSTLSCNVAGINLVDDRVNGKPVRAYPYWIDRPNCNWHSLPVAEDKYEDDDDDVEEPESEDKERGNRKGWISRLTTWWKRRDAITINFCEGS